MWPWQLISARQLLKSRLLMFDPVGPGGFKPAMLGAKNMP
jgi:hypothetical protein